jgi:two-component system capsular synthesis response regulator RcsB
MKILLADDHPVVMLGASNVLSACGDHVIVGFATSASDLAEKASALAPDVIITDYNMPGDERHGDGLVLVRYLRRTYPEVKILIYTMITSPVIVASLYQVGVSGVLSKSNGESELLRAVSVVCCGGVYRPAIHRTLSDRLLPDAVASRVDTLSTREMDVVRHFLSGKGVGEIAVMLNRSIKTISTHKISAMRKLGVETDHELVMLGLCHDLFG